MQTCILMIPPTSGWHFFLEMLRFRFSPPHEAIPSPPPNSRVKT